MPWITVPVICIIEDLEADQIRQANVILENLNLPLKELPPPETEIRQGELNTNHIVLYYPSNDPNKTIVECVNEHYSIAMSKESFKTLLFGKLHEEKANISG